MHVCLLAVVLMLPFVIQVPFRFLEALTCPAQLCLDAGSLMRVEAEAPLFNRFSGRRLLRQARSRFR